MEDRITLEVMEIDINDISETALLMVLAHARDVRHNNSVLSDVSSLQVLEAIKSSQLKTNPRLASILRKGKIDRALTNYIVLRAKYYDDQVRAFAKKYEDVTIVNIGCGLDGRFDRVDDGNMQFIDLDFEDIINLKSQFFTPTDRYLQVSQSVFDMSWMDQVEGERVLLLAEGVFMYCEVVDIKMLFKAIAERWEKSELVCELYNSLYLSRGMNTISKWTQRLKYGFGEGAEFTFGVRNGMEISSWDERIIHVSDWSYLDSKHPVLGPLAILRHVPLVRSVIWTSSYVIN